jgi:hypothetical protein
MAYTTIDDPSAYFQTLLYTGDSSNPRDLVNDGNSDLQPDFAWIKGRSDTDIHLLYDSSRGAGKFLSSASTAAENTGGYGLTAFNSDGFRTNAYAYSNENTHTYVAWQWKVNGGTTTSLSSNINSVCQVNQDAGISIVKYTCTGGGNGQAVQHGLGLVPQVIITKNRTDTSYSDWITYHHSIGYTNFLKLNTDAAQAGSSPYNGAEPTSSTYNVSIDLVEATKDYVSYVFAPIQGYSKFGSYVGNGSGTSDGTYDGAFVYLGFKPAWVLIKRSSYSAGDGWVLFDSTRPPRGGSTTGNYNQNKLNPASDAAESGAVYDAVDFLSNGFKARTGRAGVNASGSTYIYMAFAENPFVTSTGIPTTAR